MISSDFVIFSVSMWTAAQDSNPWPNDSEASALPGSTTGGSITVPLTSCLTSLESAVWLLTILFLFAKQTDPNQSNRRSTVQWYFPFSTPWLYHWLHVYTSTGICVTMLMANFFSYVLLFYLIFVFYEDNFVIKTGQLSLVLWWSIAISESTSLGHINNTLFSS
jgi:hypothetical protein